MPGNSIILPGPGSIQKPEHPQWDFGCKPGFDVVRGYVSKFAITQLVTALSLAADLEYDFVIHKKITQFGISNLTGHGYLA
jgi:hypothetical protein